MKKEPPFMEVIWMDAWADGEEVSPEKVLEAHKPVVMHTRGWVLADDAVGVTLFYERDPENDTFRGRTFIPRGMVLSVEALKGTRKRKKKDDLKEN